MGEMRNGYNILVGKPEGERPLGRPGLRKILQWILEKQVEGGGGWTGYICGSGREHLMGCCEYGNEPSGSIKSGKFLD
jgi:hypothetical protein